MATSQLLVIDSRDDRRELGYLLGKLSPRERIGFLKWCCSQVPQGTGRLPVPNVWGMKTTIEQAYRSDEADARLTREVYMDLLQLFSGNWGLDAVKTALELERRVKAFHRGR